MPIMGPQVTALPRSEFERGIVEDRLLVIADAAAQIVADPGYEAHLRNRRLVGARSWKHIGDLGDLTFRLLLRRVDFRAKYLARRVRRGPCVRANQLLGIR